MTRLRLPGRRKQDRTTSSATVTFWCMTVLPGGAPTMRPTWSPTVTGISHQPSPHERMPRSRHMRTYSSRRSSARAGTRIRFGRFAVARFELADGEHELELYWLDAYGGGIFLPFGDGTNGQETYGAGRYLLDTVKGADLGGRGDELVLDFNFAFNPSCAYDESWACPLSPPPNRMPLRVEAGEPLPA